MRGVLLALEGDSIRVALEDCGDVAEYRRVDGGWVSELGEPVEIEDGATRSSPDSSVRSLHQSRRCS
jgi:hypothetical protein